MFSTYNINKNPKLTATTFKQQREDLKSFTDDSKYEFQIVLL